MLFRVVIILAPWWILCLTHTERAEVLSREDVLQWFQGHILDSLGLRAPPRVDAPQRLDAGRVQAIPPRVLRTSQRQQADHQSQPSQETSEIILFPVSDSSCGGSDQSHFTYYFQPSAKYRRLTLAHFWFYAGEGGTDNSTAALATLTSDGKLLQVVNAPSKSSPDGWTTYVLNQTVVKGPILLQVLCPNCHCHTEKRDKIPFLHLNARPGPARSPRSVADPIPWSPLAVDLLQRPSQERPKERDCGRAEVQISFQELGWDNWIVHPKVLTFYYCHGNCSASDRASTILGITQCCAPVPESMRSLRITTTSDGGYSYKHETLPKIIPEECTCV
ncbi:inhibin alpha chain [Dunckerocampus dactyliophorus]|uniref:inhibin alpha chain n=1 Tax=Dunckerocampus dactyliophorus TaxID=161453 RepID=UPI00240550FC|nr:inhibin alpha chain [Dunckerocampus dactyliophorus]